MTSPSFPSPEWITIAGYENVAGRPAPLAAVRA